MCPCAHSEQKCAKKAFLKILSYPEPKEIKRMAKGVLYNINE
jgi:hypothetical protein